MIPAIIGSKIGMTRILDEKGEAVTVTVVEAGPCTVLQTRTEERDGYNAVQLGFRDAKPHRSTKALIGHAAKAGTGPKSSTREVRLTEPTELEPGAVVTVELFEDGVKYVDVTGTTKGRGFAGVMKRHGFGGQQATHGVERKHRSAGSIGGHSNIGLGRGIKKGKKMAGHFGHVRRTQMSMRLIGVDRERNLLLVEGSVPGPAGGLVMVRIAKKAG
jgi:large subunit ribosomal protein L3